MAVRTPAKGAPPTPVTLPAALAAGLVFLASGAVLVLEILAVRLLAPYVGLTLETTTSIIGAALAGIAAGAALGGRLADRMDAQRMVAGMLVLGGLLALLTVPLVRWLGPGARGGGDTAALGITLISLVPVAAVLSSVSPAVARLRLHDLRASGTVVGSLSAWATAGALLGTFGTGFVLVPLMPVSTAVLAIGTVLVLAGLALALYTRTLGAGVAVVALVAMVGFGALTTGLSSPCDAETTYHCAAIETDPVNASGRLLFLDDLNHSYVDVRDPTHLAYPYIRWIANAIGADAPGRSPLRAVFIGGGGWTLPRWLVATRPGSDAHVLEVDAQLVELVRERLGLRTGSDLRATIGDARMTLRDERTGSADVVVGDAFGSLAVPWNLTTREWSEEVRRVLKPGGIYTLNVIDGGSLGLLRAEVATLLDVFDHVEMVTYPGADGHPDGGNAVLIASDRPLPADVGADAGEGAHYPRSALVRFAAGADVLRDDYAPVDQLITTS